MAATQRLAAKAILGPWSGALLALTVPAVGYAVKRLVGPSRELHGYSGDMLEAALNIEQQLAKLSLLEQAESHVRKLQETLAQSQPTAETRRSA